MKEVLKYIPGFRSGVTWKKIIASIYYVLAVIFGLMTGFDGFLLAIGLFLLVCSIIDLFTYLVTRKKKGTPIKQSVITLAVGLVMMVVVLSMPATPVDNTVEETKQPKP